MDVAASSFPSAVVFVLTALSAFFPKLAGRVILVFSTLMLGLFSLLATIDMELFRAWGFRVDAAILRYVNTPREMLASAGASPILLLAVVFVLLLVASIAGFLTLLWPGIRAWEPLSLPVQAADLRALWRADLAALLSEPGRHPEDADHPEHGVLLAECLRQPGGRQRRLEFRRLDLVADLPDRQSVSCAACRPKPVRIADSLLASDALPSIRLLRIRRPDIIVIMWESLSSKLVERLGGVKGVTPNIDSLIARRDPLRPLLRHRRPESRGTGRLPERVSGPADDGDHPASAQDGQAPRAESRPRRGGVSHQFLLWWRSGIHELQVVPAAGRIRQPGDQGCLRPTRPPHELGGR